MNYLDLFKSWGKFKKSKIRTVSIDQFEYYLEENLNKIVFDINSKVYKHGPYQRLIIQEKKRRDLAVASVGDRVIHRYIYDQLVNIFDKSFDPDVWSSRKNKGLHKALKRTQELLIKYPYSYVWRADITKFFYNVNHDILIECIRRKINPDHELFWLCKVVINSYNSSRAEQSRAEQSRAEQSRAEQSRADQVYL